MCSKTPAESKRTPVKGNKMLVKYSRTIAKSSKMPAKNSKTAKSTKTLRQELTAKSCKIKLAAAEH